MANNGIITGPDLEGLDPLVDESPVVGIPAGQKGRPRVDFRPTDFDVFLETKGLRVAWSQSAVCACVGINRQTDQPDPNCPECGGTGHLYYRPADYDPAVIEGAGQFSELQKHLINRSDSPAVVIRVSSIGMERKEQPYDRIGYWGEGTVNVTVRQNHFIGHYDRLTYLDSLMAYAQTVIADAPSVTPVKLRFPAHRIDFLRDRNNRYEPDVDFVLDDQGRICFLPGRAPSGTNVFFTTRYLHHPQFLVMSYLNTVRDTLITSKKSPEQLRSPQGDHARLPIRVMAQLEFLAGLGQRSEVPSS